MTNFFLLWNIFHEKLWEKFWTIQSFSWTKLLVWIEFGKAQQFSRIMNKSSLIETIWHQNPIFFNANPSPFSINSAKITEHSYIFLAICGSKLFLHIELILQNKYRNIERRIRNLITTMREKVRWIWLQRLSEGNSKAHRRSSISRKQRNFVSNYREYALKQVGKSCWIGVLNFPRYKTRVIMTNLRRSSLRSSTKKKVR